MMAGDDGVSNKVNQTAMKRLTIHKCLMLLLIVQIFGTEESAEQENARNANLE